MAQHQDEVRREVRAAVETRHELGPDYEAEIAASLLNRVNQLSTQRRDEFGQDMDRAIQRDKRFDKADADWRTKRFVLGIVSLGASIPVTTVAATNVEPGLVAIAISWAGIIGVNVAAALGRPKDDRDR